MEVEQHHGDYQPVDSEKGAGGFRKGPHGEKGQNPGALYDQMLIGGGQGLETDYQSEQQYLGKHNGQDEGNRAQKSRLEQGMHHRIVHVGSQQ